MTILSSRPEPEHDHDFHEVFYVDGGAGWHHIDGERRPLVPGVLAIVHAADAHAFTADRQELQLVNLAFARTAWTDVLRRYFPDVVDPLRADVTTRSRQLSVDDHDHLRRITDRLRAADRTRAHLDHFLIEVLWIWLRMRARPAEVTPAPEWLTTAVRDFATPGQLRVGVDAFADLAGRSADHVARAAKRWLGQTPTQIVNAARMTHAAALLAGTDRSILDVADEVGLPNLAHFYKLFAARHGCTPRHYRLQHFHIVGQAPPARA